MGMAAQIGRKIDTSIVLATCSRSGMLRDALGSLLGQQWDESKPVEILVVDDASTDDTPAVLAEFQRVSPVPFTILQGPGLGVAAARNLGSQHARGTWIASFDDDQVAMPGWLRELRWLADCAHAGCIGGALALKLPEGRRIEELGPRVRRVLGEHLLGGAPVRYSENPHPATNNVLIRREIFDTVGGYDISFTEGGEDKEFFRRVSAAGHPMWYQPKSLALHVMTERRLAPENLRWTCLRVGAADVRLLLASGKLVGLVGHALMRLGVTLGRDVPQLVAAKLKNDRRGVLDTQCSLWYSQGLVRAMGAMLGGHPERSRFLRNIDFRTRNGERASETLRPGAGTAGSGLAGTER